MKRLSSLGQTLGPKICADDFGETPEIDQGILELIRKGQIQAVSVLTICDGDSRSTAELRTHSGQIQIGLHLALTRWPMLSTGEAQPSYFTRFFQALIGQISVDSIRKEIAAQVFRFREKFGFYPDYIDGHEHVHFLKGIREALVLTLKSWPSDQRPWIRVPRTPPWTHWPKTVRSAQIFLRSQALSFMGGKLRAALAADGVQTNRYLFGFVPPGDDRAFLLALEMAQSFWDQGVDPSEPTTGDWFFCHPGLNPERLSEWRALSSAETSTLSQRKNATSPVLIS